MDVEIVSLAAFPGFAHGVSMYYLHVRVEVRHLRALEPFPTISIITLHILHVPKVLNHLPSLGQLPSISTHNIFEHFTSLLLRHAWMG